MSTTKIKKLLSVLLAFVMVAGLVPAAGFHVEAAVDSSGVTLERGGTTVSASSIINSRDQMVKVYTITDSGEYVLTTSGVSQYGVTIILDNNVTNVSLVLDNVNIQAQAPVMPDSVNGISYNNSIHGGLVVYNSDDLLSNLDIIIKGRNTINVSDINFNSTSAMLVRGCNTILRGFSEDNELFLASSAVNSYGLLNLTKDGYVGGAVSFESAPYLGLYDGARVFVDVQQGQGVITARELHLYDGSQLDVHSSGIGIQSYVDEAVLVNGYYGLYVDNSSLFVNTSGGGIGINNGGVLFTNGSTIDVNAVTSALSVINGNITFNDISYANIRSTEGYGLSLNDKTLSVDFNSDNITIFGYQYAIMGMPEYSTSRGFIGDYEVVTLHSDDGGSYTEFTDMTTKKYIKTSTRTHTHDFGEDYYESDVAGNHYKLCACGEMSELEECTYSFHYFEPAPDIENDGIKVYFCDYCGGRKDVIVPAHNCNAYTNFQIDENGNHYGTCTYEGCERFIDEPHNLELLEELDENSHKLVCGACGYYETEEHLFVEFELIDEATHEAYCECGYIGIKPHDYFETSGNNDGETHTSYCYCGAEITGEHSWSEWEETPNGHFRVCDTCGAEEHGAHQWDDYYGISMLEHQHECLVCNKLENLDHVWGDWVDRGDKGHSHDCVDCGWRITEEHEFEKCGDNGDGTHTFYCWCGGTVIQEHNWGDWIEADDGSGTYHTCYDCYTTEYCSHEWSDWYGISSLQHQHTCELCGTVKNSRHTWESWVDNGETHSHDCSGCGWRITESHDYINVSDDENGTTHTIYCICGKGETSEHDWSPWIDTEDGKHKRECNTCGAEEITEHNWGEWQNVNEELHWRFCNDCSAREDGMHTSDSYTDLGEDGHRFGCAHCDKGVVQFHEFVAFTDNGNGTHTCTCKCGYIVIEEHFHFFADNGNGTHTGVCDCGDEVTESHSYDFSYDIIRDPDENRPGSKREYCSCGAHRQRTFVSYYDINGDGEIDALDYQALVNEALEGECEQSVTNEYTEIVKYDLDGDGAIDVLDCAIMERVVSGNASIWEVQIIKRGDFDLDGSAYSNDDLIGMYYALSDCDTSAHTLTTAQKFAADFNYDGRINNHDFDLLIQKYPRVESLIK